MADLPRVFIHTGAITTWWINLLGKLFLRGKLPSHSRLYWIDSNLAVWMTELTTDAPTNLTEVVGRGDGYMIQITKIDNLQSVQGTLVPVLNCDADKIRTFACKYGNTDSGTYNTFECVRWYTEPQGWGGPQYDERTTSNTYISWLLRKSCVGPIPPMPTGGLGWGSNPEFPGKN